MPSTSTLSDTTNIEMKKSVLLETLKTIPRLQREVFILKTIYNKSTKDICTTLKINEKLFWACMYHARQHLFGH